MIKTDWHGCYSQGWGKNLVPASYAHPAKVSFKLAERIYQHAIEEGWVKAGSIVCDPFTGISGFGLHAMINGLHFIGVELEQKFVDLGSFYNCPGVSKKEWVRYFARGRSGRVNYKYGLHWCPACNPTYERNSGKIPWTEPHFFEGNIALWERKFRGLPGLGTARVVQGDSRELKEVVAGADLVCSSPPYAISEMGAKRGEGPGSAGAPHGGKHQNSGKASGVGYGSTPGQLANMPEGKVDICISSPPYSSLDEPTGGLNYKPPRPGMKDKQSGRNPQAPAYIGMREAYGQTPGQLGAMPEGKVEAIISSPPYAKEISRDRASEPYAQSKADYKRGGKSQYEVYGKDTPGQLANMSEGKVEAIISSPPYAELGAKTKGHGIKGAKGSIGHGCKADEAQYGHTPGQLGAMKEGKVDLVASSPPWENITSDHPSKALIKSGLKMGKSSMGDGYGATQGQLGKELSDTFWSAARLILEQCFDLLKPGGHSCWVTKDYIRDGKRIPFSQNWANLCESVGFKLVCWHRAWLVKEHGIQMRADGEEPLTSERKSFFRRNIETKKKAAKFWLTLAPDVQAEWVEKAQGLVTKPTEKKVLAKAQVEAFKGLCFDDRPYRDELMIDEEDVLCMVKE